MNIGWVSRNESTWVVMESEKNGEAHRLEDLMILKN